MLCWNKYKMACVSFQKQTKSDFYGIELKAMKVLESVGKHCP